MKQGRWMIVMAAGVLVGSACDNKGSLGKFTDSANSSDAGNDTGDDGDGGLTSTSGDDNGVSDGGNDQGNDGDSDDDGGVSDGIMLDVGPAGECEQGCAIECTPEQCGPLDRHHPDGCLKRPCQNDDPCDDGERCYFAALFGGCESSGWDCFDNDGTCTCGGDADCGGGYCVDEDAYPIAATGPEGPSRVQNGCAPNDGPAKDIHIGLEDASCGAAFADGPTLRISIYNLDPGDVGTFEIGTNDALAGQAFYDDGTGTVFPASVGTVTIDEYAEFVAGSYEVFINDDLRNDVSLHLSGQFDLAEDCLGDPGCG